MFFKYAICLYWLLVSKSLGDQVLTQQNEEQWNHILELRERLGKAALENKILGRQHTADDTILLEDEVNRLGVNMYKYVVIYQTEGVPNNCIGVIVDEYSVLTASHCGRSGRFVKTGYQNRHRILQFIPYSNVNKNNISVNFDLQILKLKRPIKFNVLLQPIGFDGDIRPGEVGKVALFTTRNGMSIITNAKRLPDEDCQKELENKDLKDTYCVEISKTIDELEECEKDANLFIVHEGRFVGMSAFTVECGGPENVSFVFRTYHIVKWLEKYVNNKPATGRINDEH